MGGAAAGGLVGGLLLGGVVGWVVGRKGTGKGRKGGYQAAGQGEAEEKRVGETGGEGGKGDVMVTENRVHDGNDEINEFMRLWRKYGDPAMLEGEGNQVHQMPGNTDGS